MLNEVLSDLSRYKIPYDYSDVVKYVESNGDRLPIQIVEHFRCEWIRKSRGVDGFIKWANKSLYGIENAQSYQQIYGKKQMDIALDRMQYDLQIDLQFYMEDYEAIERQNDTIDNLPNY